MQPETTQKEVRAVRYAGRDGEPIFHFGVIVTNRKGIEHLASRFEPFKSTSYKRLRFLRDFSLDGNIFLSFYNIYNIQMLYVFVLGELGLVHFPCEFYS